MSVLDNSGLVTDCSTLLDKLLGFLCKLLTRHSSACILVATILLTILIILCFGKSLSATSSNTGHAILLIALAPRVLHYSASLLKVLHLKCVMYKMVIHYLYIYSGGSPSRRGNYRCGGS